MSKKSNVNNRPTLAFAEVLSLIQFVGALQTIVVEGQPGIGKTGMAKQIAQVMNMDAVVVDCATMVDGGDVTIPWMMGEVFEHRPNSIYQTSREMSAPIVLCLDEIGKANRSVIAAITPIIRDRKVAGVPLHKDTIVYCTSNNADDNVGDNIPAHIWNGVTSVQMRNPSVDEWLESFAYKAGIGGEVIAWIKNNPHAFDHYTQYTDHKDNAMIFDPRDSDRRQYVSPRSLERIDRVLKRRHQYQPTALLAAVAGTIGAPAAHDMITMIHLSDRLPSFDEVCRDPLKVMLPDRGVGQIINALNMLNNGNHGTTAQRAAVTTYIQRMESEIKAMFTSAALTGHRATDWMNLRPMTDMASQIGAIL